MTAHPPARGVAWLSAFGLTVAFALAFQRAVSEEVAIGAGAQSLAAPASAAIASTLFLLPVAVEGGFRLANLMVAAGLTAAIALTLAISSSHGLAPVSVPAIGPATVSGLMIFLLGSLAVTLKPLTGSHRAGIAWGIMLALAVAASPVWLGPVLDRIAPGRTFIDALVAINPITHLAVFSNTDYLRGDWFYRYSLIGSWRYDYPSSAATLLAYLLLCGLASQFARRISRGRAERRSRPASCKRLWLSVPQRVKT